MAELLENSVPYVRPPATQWLEDFHAAAKVEFDRQGFPTGKEEGWRFTQIKPVVSLSFAPAGPADGRARAEQFTFGTDAGVEFVFVNGAYSPELSSNSIEAAGVCVSTLANALQGSKSSLIEKTLGTAVTPTGHAFAAYNGVHFNDGAFVHIERGVTVEKPLHFLFISVGAETPVAVHPRVLVVLEDNVEVTIVESYVGTGTAYLTNAVTEIIAGQDCRIDHCKLQLESKTAFHLANQHVRLGRNSRFVSHAATIGGRVTRNDLTVDLLGRHADATLNGLVVLEGDQHCDNHTLLNHAAPDCPSHELYKHVLDGKSSAVFKGKIYVARIAQKTDAKQTSKSLLLSDNANINSQPALEIYADDVKCTHGSTIGPIDDEHVFYLRSRGVDLATARHLLTYAFAADVTRRIRVEPVRRRLEDFLAVKHGLPQDIRINDLGAHDEKVTN